MTSFTAAYARWCYAGQCKLRVVVVSVMDALEITLGKGFFWFEKLLTVPIGWLEFY